MTSGLRQRWEDRAVKKSSAYEGVLFQGLPSELNQYLHNRHAHVLCDRLLPAVPRGARILDLGCAYGRLGSLIRARRPDLELIGCDFSLPYCLAFKQNTASTAVGAELSKLPFRSAAFDALIAVTVLMYVEPVDRLQALARMCELLKPGGVMLWVDPGGELQKFVSRMRPGIARQSTGGIGFSRNEMEDLARSCELEVIACGGIPWFSFALPLLYGMSALGLASDALLQRLGQRDDANVGRSYWSLHRWIILRRPAAEAKQ